MKRVFIIHGWDGSPDEAMHQQLKEQLETSGFSVTVPAMPNPEAPVIAQWLEKMSDVVGVPDSETYFIGHSIGCQAVLRYLEAIDISVGKVILIAPWMELDQITIEEEGQEVVEIARPWMETPIDFEKLKNSAPSFHAIFSDNDPYVPLHQQEFFKEKLGATTVVQHNKGHFNEPDEVIEVISEVIKMLE
ncbi:MAG: alpha/beta hydrolase [Candidatus Nomurabacteria bacterium]|nr:alpha/beta hydrolase [Candidatus Nomurabacteria bacterium]